MVDRTLTPSHLRLIEALADREVKAYLQDPVAYEKAIEEGGDPLQLQQENRRTCLYRHFNADGCLLYVGVSYSPSDRKHHHNWASSWFPQVARTTMGWFATRRAALDAELRAIKEENPLHNLQGKPGGKPA